MIYARPVPGGPTQEARAISQATAHVGTQGGFEVSPLMALAVSGVRCLTSSQPRPVRERVGATNERRRRRER